MCALCPADVAGMFQLCCSSIMSRTSCLDSTVQTFVRAHGVSLGLLFSK
jgi:hypothetical protein